MGGSTECEVVASHESIVLLVRALAGNLKRDGYRRQKVGALEGPAVFQYFHEQNENVIAVATRAAPGGCRLRVESETMDVAPVVGEAMARAAADLLHELLSGQSDKLRCVSSAEVHPQFMRLASEYAP